MRSGFLDSTNGPVPGTVSELAIARATRDALIDHLRAALPNEGCGLLATLDTGTTRRVMRFYPGVNIDRSPTRYTMDPRQVAAAIEDMEAIGWCLGAIAHSHPRTPPLPSATDLREAYYPRTLLVIASFVTGVAELRAWDVSAARAPDQSREVPVTTLLD